MSKLNPTRLTAALSRVGDFLRFAASTFRRAYGLAKQAHEARQRGDEVALARLRKEKADVERQSVDEMRNLFGPPIYVRVHLGDECLFERNVEPKN